MSGFRLPAPSGSRLDRGNELSFTFDGRAHRAFSGDTLASALLASGERLVGRSFKLHRPRGIFSCGVEEPNAILDVECNGIQDPDAGECPWVAHVNAWGYFSRARLSDR